MFPALNKRVKEEVLPDSHSEAELRLRLTWRLTYTLYDDTKDLIKHVIKKISF